MNGQSIVRCEGLMKRYAPNDPPAVAGLDLVVPKNALSGAARRRIGVAQALVNRPTVLFLDEPVSALDPIGRKEVLEFIDRLREETTVFMSTYILADVERVCDVVGVLNQGRMVVVEDTATLEDVCVQRVRDGEPRPVESGTTEER
jgi:ABC-type multidrug transport system ATPase subunit